jgi:phosphatidylglycerol:prolipoprotein diacylglycerol transferase
MKPELFSIGSFTVYSYGLMMALGVISCVLVAEKRAEKLGLEKDRIFDLAVWGVIGGILGAKILYWIVEWKSIVEDPSILLDIGNGFVVYGGLIGGVFGGWLYTRVHKLNFLRYLDLAVPSIALAQGFGRIGCFLAGCCYGRVTDSWFHVVFQESHIAPNNVWLLPTQLISSAADFAHFALLLCLAKKTKGDGQLGGIYLICYSIGRTLVEMLRDDPRGNVGGISTSQFISLFILILGVAMVVLCGKKGKADPAAGEAKDEA